MIEGNRDVTLTTAGRDYVLPTSDASRRKAELKFFSTPSAFRFLIDRFDGHQLPPSKTIATLLQRSNVVPLSWVKRTAAIFIGSAEELRLIDRGFLRFGAAEHSLGASIGTITDSLSTPQVPPTDRFMSPGGYALMPPQPPGSAQTSIVAPDMNTWVYTEGGGTVTLKTPNPLPLPLWERLTRYVEMLRPTDGP